jgi:hydroxyacylglutathione hydrolase
VPLIFNSTEQPVLEYGPVSGQKWQLPFDNYEGELKYLDEGDVVRMGDDALHVLFTPGHSPGSISFYSRENKVLISGDVLFHGSVGRTDLPGGDFAILEESIKTKLYTLPADTIVYSGHGDTTTIGDEMKGNPFVQMI